MTDNSIHNAVLFPFGFGSAAKVPDISTMGIKGANLVDMANVGLPVPPGFVLNTQLGQRIASGQDALEAEVREEIRETIHALEDHLGRQFGAGPSPLLLSVRSGAAISMQCVARVGY